MKLDECIARTAEKIADSDVFFGHGTDNPTDEAAYLILEGLGIGFDDVEFEDRELSRDELSRLEQLLEERLAERKPVAYIVGKAWFAGHPFHCDERALVPRSPIAELINANFEPLLPVQPKRILDLCTGGGAIGLAAALQFPASRVDLADISADALTLAEDNIKLHKLQDRVRTIHSDLFSNVDSAYDLIISNPPYVSEQEVEGLPAEYHHEPELGLVSEDEGLAIPLKIMAQAADYLNPEGVLILEVGYSHDLLAKRLSNVAFLWLDFEFGGEGVLSLTASELRQYRGVFN